MAEPQISNEPFTVEEALSLIETLTDEFAMLDEAVARANRVVIDLGPTEKAVLLGLKNIARATGVSATAVMAAEAGFTKASQKLTQNTGLESFALKFGAIPAIVLGYFDRIKGLVGTLSPGAIIAFDYQLKSLSATVGTALLPAFGVLTNTVRTAANLLGPAMAAASGPFKAVASAVSSALLPVITTVATLLRGLSPVLTLLAFSLQVAAVMLRALGAAAVATAMPAFLLFKLLEPVLKVLIPVFRAVGYVLDALMKIVNAAANAFLKMLGFDASKWGKTIEDAGARVARSLVLLAAALAKFIGFAGFTQALREELGQSGAAAPAATSPSIAESQGVQHAMEQAAFIAGGTEESDQDIWKGMDEKLANLKDLKTTIKDAVKEALGATPHALEKHIADSLPASLRPWAAAGFGALGVATGGVL